MTYTTSTALKPLAGKLRAEFDAIMSDPHSPDRFQWDWWHLPGRYTHLRAPAAHFFSADIFDKLESELLAFGREHLGCQEISPIWLSCYIEGCEQRLHADRPHGPWAFVLSLSPEELAYQGGETMMVRPEILSLWNQGVPAGQAFEETEIVERIPAQPGRLLIFDPRIPHGVSRVSGTLDPLKGRLVLHGWFAQPSPFVEGPLSPEAAEAALSAFDDILAETFSTGFEATGTTAYRIEIGADGKVTKIKQLATSFMSAEREKSAEESKKLTKAVRDHFLKWKFPKAKKSSQITLPLSFER